MNLREIVKTLRARGHKVGYKARKDGSIRITSIDGNKFNPKYSLGNQTARTLAGGSLSERKRRQLERGRKIIKGGIEERRAARKQGRPPRPKAPKLNAEVQKALRKAQRKIRKLNLEGKETITARNVREYIEKYGEKEAVDYLTRRSRYYEGFAYTDNVKYIVDSLKADAEEIQHAGIMEYAEKLWDEKDIFLEQWVNPLYNAIYDFEEEANAAKGNLVELTRIADRWLAAFKAITSI